MIPVEDTRILVDPEMEGARSWAGRHSVSIEWLPEPLEVRAVMAQPETGEQFFVRGLLEGYRALAPEWTFTDECWATAGVRQHYFPKVTGAPGSMFIVGGNGPIICAHFNRLAFGQHGGPHEDWGGPANWLSASGDEYVRAETLGDMLQAIYRDVLRSRGRMG